MEVLMTVRCIQCTHENILHEVDIFANETPICKDCFAPQIATSVSIVDDRGIERHLLVRSLQRLLCSSAVNGLPL